MSETPADPIQSVKEFLHRGTGAARAGIAADLRQIAGRLARARRVERGLKLSKGLVALFRSAEIPLA